MIYMRRREIETVIEAAMRVSVIRYSLSLDIARTCILKQVSRQGPNGGDAELVSVPGFIWPCITLCSGGPISCQWVTVEAHSRAA
jgi:hypothetical protein